MSCTVLVPANVYVCDKLVSVVLLVAPSPKFQKRLVIVPVEESVNATARGATPLVGVPEKAATGTCAPVPATVLVALPPLAVVKMTLLVNPPTATGVNCTTTLLDPPGGSANVAPDRIEYGPPVTEATPLVTVVPPVFVTVNTPC